VKDHNLFTALKQCCTVPSCQNDIRLCGSYDDEVVTSMLILLEKALEDHRIIYINATLP